MAGKQKSSSGSAIGGRIVTFLFGLLFFGIGIVLMWIAGLQPLVKYVQSLSWEEVSCRIVSSQVESHASSDGTTYSVNISYTYDWEGRTYRSDRYNNSAGSSSGRKGKAEIVRQYPPGKQATCFVNPANPEEAVLVRSAGWMAVFAIPFTGIFVLIGGFFIYSSFTPEPLLANKGGKGSGFSKPKKKRKVPSGKATWKKGHFDYPEEQWEAIVLKPEVSRIAGLIGMLIFCLFWNGIVSIFVREVVKQHLKGDPDWFLTLFMIPFVLVGLGLIVGVIYSFLKLFNPKVEMTLNPGTPRMGEPFMVSWRVEGNTKRLKNLRILLEAEEIASYQRGTDTITERNIFEQVELSLQEASQTTDYSGSTDLVIPRESMHSFNASNNQILWTIKVHGDIPRWPDVSSIFPVDVLPAKPSPTNHE